jgi:hypothetical protein
MTKSIVLSNDEIVKDLQDRFTKLCSKMGEHEVTVQVQMSMIRNHFHLVFQNVSLNSTNLQKIKETFKACGGIITACVYPPLNNLSLHASAKPFYDCLNEMGQPLMQYSMQNTARNTFVTK